MAYCEHDYSHDGDHSTSNHRNKENNIYLSNRKDNKIEY